MFRLESGFRMSLFVLVCTPLVFSTASACGQSKPASPSEEGWKLIWHDEFDGPNGSQPDAHKWTVLTNDSGFGNNEKEYYTPRPTNVRLENGNLVITAQEEKFTGPDGQTREYTSGRLETHGHFDFTYGRVEARLKMPHGQGIWPAFWMLGSNFKAEPWPACGEIDTMENVGFEPSVVHGSLHGPGYFGGNPLSGEYTLPDGAKFSDDFHVFAVEWEPNEIRFYVDGKLFETQTASSVPKGGRWVFDHKHFIILNVAVGGFWPGQPDATTKFPTQMLVDYVRVYKPVAKAHARH